jgi:flagellar motor component MotA
LKGAPHSREAYNELVQGALRIVHAGPARRHGGLEEHVMNPETSNIFAKYPTFQKEKKAMEFLCNGLRPIIDGKIKPDHLKMLLEIELEAMEEEHERPVSVLTKAADAMPGFGIVAAVLGIVLTMSSISGPIEEIGDQGGGGAGGNLFGHFPFLRVYEPAGGQHGVYESWRRWPISGALRRRSSVLRAGCRPSWRWKWPGAGCPAKSNPAPTGWRRC